MRKQFSNENPCTHGADGRGLVRCRVSKRLKRQTNLAGTSDNGRLEYQPSRDSLAAQTLGLDTTGSTGAGMSRHNTTACSGAIKWREHASNRCRARRHRCSRLPMAVVGRTWAVPIWRLSIVAIVRMRIAALLCSWHGWRESKKTEKYPGSWASHHRRKTTHVGVSFGCWQTADPPNTLSLLAA